VTLPQLGFDEGLLRRGQIGKGGSPGVVSARAATAEATSRELTQIGAEIRTIEIRPSGARASSTVRSFVLSTRLAYSTALAARVNESWSFGGRTPQRARRTCVNS